MPKTVNELLASVAADPKTRPRLAHECRQFGDQLRALGITDYESALMMLLGMYAAADDDRRK